jgi:hypothetical protein
MICPDGRRVPQPPFIAGPLVPIKNATMTNYNRKTIKKTAGFLFCIFILFSCDYSIHQSGIVVDKETNSPLDSATVIFQRDTMWTNSFGLYEFTHRFKKPKQELIISRSGYKPMYLLIGYKRNYLTYSVKRSFEYVDLKTPKYIHNDPNQILYSEINWTTSINFEVLDIDSLKIKLEKK